jgi:hypothetical protein
MIIPSFLNPRQWPGVRSWILTVLGCVAVFELLAAFAWRNERSGFLDLTTALVSIPVATLVVILIIAALWALLLNVPFTGCLSGVSRLLPLAWAVPMFDLIRSAGQGTLYVTPIVDGNGYLGTVFSGGLFPLDSGLTVGMRLGTFAAVVGTALVVWVYRKSVWRTVLAAFLTSATLAKMTFMAAGLGLWERIVHYASYTGRMGWIAEPFEVSRSVIQSVDNGYWWTNLYERFPTAIDTQSVIAIRLTTAGLLVFSLGCVLAIAFVWQLPAWKKIRRHVYAGWGMMDLAVCTVGAGIITSVILKIPVFVSTGWWAVDLVVMALAALRLSSVLRRDLHNLVRDERENANQPIVRGDLSVDDARELADISLWFVLITSWVLGWPVFACILVYLAAAHLSRDRVWTSLPWTIPIFRAVGAAAIALASFFFVSQTAKIVLAAVVVSCLAATYCLAVEFMWKRQKAK